MTGVEIISSLVLSGMFAFSTYRLVYADEQYTMNSWMALFASISTGIGLFDLIG